MSSIFTGTDVPSLAGRLVEAVTQQVRTGDPFEPVTIVVPHRLLQRRLQLHLARRLGAAVNLRFRYLENALWEMLAEIDDPGRHEHPPELLGAEEYRLLVLAVLLEGGNPDLAPLRRYVFRDEADLDRHSSRRAWQLADRLSFLIRDYEYHRQEELILPWLQEKDSPLPFSPAERETERGQRALFRGIIEEPEGARARLNRALGRTFKTLPQYAGEIAEYPPPLPGRPRRTVHLFGITQMSALHVAVLAGLAGHFDLRFYVPHPSAGSLSVPNRDPGHESQRPAVDRMEIDLVRSWGRAGEESLALTRRLLQAPGIRVEQVDVPGGSVTATVLERVQAHLRGRDLPEGRVSQDVSLQIVPCPGQQREIETVYWSIVDNLRRDPTLRATDIAVLAVDLGKYRPILQAVFERRPDLVGFDLAEFSAGGTSLYGQAAVGMLDLALETFTRSGVLQILQNPCFLARLGAEPEQVRTWLEWAERLGVFQGWDGEDGDPQKKKVHLYSWRLALRRLRLGRFMAPAEDPERTPRFGDIVPHADLESSEMDTLDAFCRAVEDLLPALARLRGLKVVGGTWRRLLTDLFQRFLEVPEDRPAEAAVRHHLLAGLERLDSLEKIAGAGAALSLPLALVREMVASAVQDIPARKGEPGIGGVTVAALGAARLVPYRVVYVVGLDENSFPGSDALTTLDLRQRRRPGDIRPAEMNRFLFLETILAAREKLYLTYPDRDLQKDGAILPAVPVVQLQRFLEEKVLATTWADPRVPLLPQDPAPLVDPQDPSVFDATVLGDEADRTLALEEARANGRLRLRPDQEREHVRRYDSLRRRFPLEAMPSPQRAEQTITLKRLADFLKNPAEVSLQNLFKGREEEEEAEVRDDEPFTADRLTAHALIREVMERMVVDAQKDPSNLDAVLKGVRQVFERLYENERLRCRLPDGVFAEVERRFLAEDIAHRLEGPEKLEGFLKQRARDGVVGPLLLGESWTPIGANTRLPALEIEVPAAPFPLQVRLVGQWKLAWRGADGLEMLVVKTGKHPGEPDGTIPNEAILEPMLLHLALLALPSYPPDLEFLSQGCRIHVAWPEAVETFAFPPDSISPEEARSYLVDLLADLFAPERLDLIPFKVLIDNRFRKAFLGVLDGTYEGDAAAFREALQDGVEVALDSGRNVWWWSPAFDLAGAVVPEDALDIVRRRFGPLARALPPAQAAEEPRAKSTKTGKGKKPGGRRRKK